VLTCKSCGAALDLAMSACPECGVGVELGRLTGILGIVCRACDAYNDPGARSCVGCGKPIGAGIAAAPPPAPAAPAPGLAAPAAAVVAVAAPADPAASPAAPPAPPASSPVPPAAAAAVPAAPNVPAVRPPAPAAPPPVAPRVTPPAPLRTPLIGTIPPLGAPPPSPRPAPPPAAAQPPAPRQPAPPPGGPVVRTYQRGAGVTRVIPLARAGGQAGIPCPRCGEVAGGGQFCQRCGQPLGPQAAPPPPAAAPAPGARADLAEPASGRAAAASGQAEPAADRAAVASGQAEPALGRPGAPAGRARIHLERGEGPEGVTFRLGAEVVEAGRSRGEVVFPADPCLAPHHATFFYRDGALHVRDEGAAGGIYLRLRGPSAPLRPGDHFAVGDRLLRFAGFLTPAPSGPADGTRRLGAPRHGGPTALVEEWLEGGIIGRVFVRAGPSITIGRAGCAISLGDDPYLSQAHAELVLEGEGQARLRDLGSANGTYLRVPSHAERELHDGDGLRLGREVLRVSIA